jgi:hypothetical protein
MARPIVTLALAIGLIATSAHAQTVSLTQPPPLTKGMPALPHIAAPITPATTKINAALAKVDTSWRAFLKDCHDQAGADFDMERSNQVAMRGPGYFAVTIGYSYDCGGAHPDGGSIALAYDLNTGRPLNWAQLLPKALVDSTSTDSAGDGTTIGLITSKALQKIYAREALAHADADFKSNCADTLTQDGLTFQVWPDAKSDGLMLQPDLPHVVLACGDPQVVSVQTLRRLGVSAPLLSAIEAAHAVAH